MRNPNTWSGTSVALTDGLSKEIPCVILATQLRAAAFRYLFGQADGHVHTARPQGGQKVGPRTAFRPNTGLRSGLPHSAGQLRP